jgi:hypothetical protein
MPVIPVDTESGGWQVQDQPEPHNDILPRETETGIKVWFFSGRKKVCKKRRFLKPCNILNLSFKDVNSGAWEDTF